MLISCKCLNFIATSNNQQKQTLQQQQLQAASAAVIATADLKENNAVAAAATMEQLSDCNTTLLATSSNNSISKYGKDECNESSSITDALRQTFLQKYPRHFIFYSQCVDFFKQAIGPVLELSISVLSQKDLIYSFTVEITKAESSSGIRSSWQLCICSNCSVVLYAKRVNINSPQFLINCGLLTNNEELSQKRLDKSFSDTFGLLIMDNPKLEVISKNQNASNNLTAGSLSTSFVMSSASSQHLDSKQLRLRQLQANLQQRLQREIAETDERIQRYTSQQFALLKSFREKSEQEYQMLVSLIQCIPEQQANEWLERQPPALEVSNNSVNLSYGGTRRRNTIASRRDLNNTATTPTTIQPPNNIFNINRENYKKNSMTTAPNSPISAITPTDSNVGNNTTLPPGEAPTSNVAAFITPTIVGNNLALHRKISNFDTPPATPEAIPMSVGNSPTFRQQQQHAAFTNQQQQTFQQQFPTPTIETADDCLFELEGVDSNAVASQSRTMNLQNPHSQHQHVQSQSVLHQILPSYNSYQSSLSYINTKPENHMSDFDESDGAEEAEDALDLDSSMSIATPHRRINVKNAALLSSFAKSLPIEISNSPIAEGRDYMTTLETEEDALDSNVDIAASIKALAKSVHGETVFGDLPRPRLRSQI